MKTQGPPGRSLAVGPNRRSFSSTFSGAASKMIPRPRHGLQRGGRPDGGQHVIHVLLDDVAVLDQVRAIGVHLPERDDPLLGRLRTCSRR